MVRGNRLRRSGFTLAEALVASAILAFAVAAAAVPFSASLMSGQRRSDQAEAVRLTEAMIEEILSRPFHDPDGASVPGPEIDEDPARRDRDFDNVDDYHGLVEEAGVLRNADGQLIYNEEIAMLTRRVTVAYVRMPEQPKDSPTSFAVVEVVVSNGKEDLARIARLVAE